MAIRRKPETKADTEPTLSRGSIYANIADDQYINCADVGQQTDESLGIMAEFPVAAGFRRRSRLSFVGTDNRSGLSQV
jgi:hypothetical protein